MKISLADRLSEMSGSNNCCATKNPVNVYQGALRQKNVYIRSESLPTLSKGI